MREILFRGKKTTNGEWVVGNYARNVFDTKLDTIEDCENFPYLVYGIDRETVGQYTGLTDKNGKGIFEGDVVRTGSGIFEFTGCVVFEQGCFQLVDPECDVYECLWYQSEELTVLGNIHDNPELIAEVEGC